MYIELENGQQISGSHLIEAILRTSLEPCPVTFECTVQLHEQYSASLLENKILKVGKYQTAVKIVFAQDMTAPFVQDTDWIIVRKIIAVHENSAGIAAPLQKAVIRENVDLSAIYRACGGKSEVQKSFKIPRFYGFAGSIASVQIARICQEHGGIVRWLPESNQLSFERIHDLFNQAPKDKKLQHSDHTFKSDFVVKQEVARYISTNEYGQIIQSQNDTIGRVEFVPQKTQAQLNAMQTVLLNAKTIPCDYSPDLNAGDLVELNSVKMVVITAAHSWRKDRQLDSQSTFWLGVKK